MKTQILDTIGNNTYTSYEISELLLKNQNNEGLIKDKNIENSNLRREIEEKLEIINDKILENSNLMIHIREKEDIIRDLILRYNDVIDTKTDNYFKDSSLLKSNLSKIEFLPDSVIQESNMALKYKDFISKNVQSFKKFASYKADSTIIGILELNNGTYAYWTVKGIGLLIYNQFKLEQINFFPLEFESNNQTIPILNDDNIIFRDGQQSLKIVDLNFNLIEIFKEISGITSICNISNLSFAVGLDKGAIKIYSRAKNSKIYTKSELDIRYYSGCPINSLLYLPNKKLLLSGTSDNSIIVLSYPEGIYYNKLTGHNQSVSTIISIDENTFASGSMGSEIKIWSIKSDMGIECTKSIKAYTNYEVYLNILTHDYMISRPKWGQEFKIWDLKTYQGVAYYDERSNLLVTKGNDKKIQNLLVTKNKYIITVTADNRVNAWKI